LFTKNRNFGQKSQLFSNVTPRQPVMTMQYLCGELDALELGMCVRRLKLFCENMHHWTSKLFGSFDNGQIWCPCPVNTTTFCPRKLLADLFIEFGTLGPDPLNYYRYWSNDDLEYRRFLLRYGQRDKWGMIKRSY